MNVLPCILCNRMFSGLILSVSLHQSCPVGRCLCGSCQHTVLCVCMCCSLLMPCLQGLQDKFYSSDPAQQAKLLQTLEEEALRYAQVCWC